MQIIHVSAECFPIAKVGGLADVVGALPKYQKAAKVKASVVMPFYQNKFINTNKNNLKPCKNGRVSLNAEQTFAYDIYELQASVLGFSVFLINIEGLTDRENVYGYSDDVERFTAFQKVVCDYINGLKEKPDIVHCHDHHTGLIPFFMGCGEDYSSLRKIPTILTIHNAQYQGEFGYDKMHYLPKFDWEKAGLLDWYGKINPLATAIKCAWKITTVSSNYLNELQQVANGLEGLLRNEQAKSIGILNGIDSEVWNPESDPMLPNHYNINTTNIGRLANKKLLCEKFKFDSNLPLVAFIGRFVYEKGSDLLAEAVHNIIVKENKPVNILILGSGNPDTQNQLTELNINTDNRFNVFVGYNEELSHIIYGGADFLLMPSRVEPCGLNQMYAMRYGMIPIVSNVGGLKDTVTDFDASEIGNGMVIENVNVSEICFAIHRAIHVYNNKPFLEKKIKTVMQLDHSWDNSASKYIQMYNSLNQLIKK